jgi:hypothetical protein
MGNSDLEVEGGDQGRGGSTGTGRTENTEGGDLGSSRSGAGGM